MIKTPQATKPRIFRCMFPSNELKVSQYQDKIVH